MVTQFDEFPWHQYDADIIIASIESPAKMYRGSCHVVRAVANQLRRTLKEAFGERLCLVGDGGPFVDPAKWRADLGIDTIAKMYHAEDLKAAAIQWCSMPASGIVKTFADHNVAEAAAIAVWGSRNFQLWQAKEAAAIKTRQKKRQLARATVKRAKAK